MISLIKAIMFVFVADTYLYWQHRFIHRFFPAQHARHHKYKNTPVFGMVDQIGNWGILPLGFLLGFTIFEMAPTTIWAIAVTLIAHDHVRSEYSHGIFIHSRDHEKHHDLYDKNYGSLLTVWDRIMGTFV